METLKTWLTTAPPQSERQYIHALPTISRLSISSSSKEFCVLTSSFNQPRTCGALYDEASSDAVGCSLVAEKLAKEIGASRSSLKFQFSQRVGLPPLSYLTQWRMILADRKLLMRVAVSETAAEVGYLSQSGFTQVFKRTLGETPRSRQRYQRGV